MLLLVILFKLLLIEVYNPVKTEVAVASFKYTFAALRLVDGGSTSMYFLHPTKKIIKTTEKCLNIFIVVSEFLLNMFVIFIPIFIPFLIKMLFVLQQLVLL